jgi:hypothetical protein
MKREDIEYIREFIVYGLIVLLGVTLCFTIGSVLLIIFYPEVNNKIGEIIDDSDEIYVFKIIPTLMIIVMVGMTNWNVMNWIIDWISCN